MLLTRGRGPELEVFLVARAPELSFFGGYWAFPGGVLDERDRDGGLDEDAALARCALRELFEETGVLPPELAARLAPSERERLRGDLIDGSAGDARWFELIAGAPEAAAGLRTFGRITTPPFTAVRYRSRLFHVELPAGEEPTILPGELTDGVFRRPETALKGWTAGEHLIVPPVLFLLHALRERSFEDALDRAARVCVEVDDGVLHPVRLTPGLWMAPLRTPTLPPATTTNAYFVGTDELYVVDPATPHADEQARLFALMDRWLEEGKRFAGVLLTHHHSDHVGAVGATSRRYDLEVHGHALTLDRVDQDFRPGRALADGDEIDLGHAPDGSPGWMLRAYHTPGHDRGHLVFVESRYRSAIAGDLVSTLSTIVIDPPEGHLATYLASLRRMLALDVGVLYPAHGPSCREAGRYLRYYLDHRREREEALVGALSRGVETPAELVRAVYVDVDPALHPIAARSLEAGLQKLADEGRARRRGTPDDPRWVLSESL